ncbi:MAG: DUF885 family protein [Cyclobacteriaceae bacterium]|nr:DUF885 family protein [Cyclobacteriaceae bacterium]
MIAKYLSLLTVGCCVILFYACSSPQPTKQLQSGSTYEELVQFFNDWREFQSPEMKDGVPDYSSAAMKKQFAELPTWQGRLNAFDTVGWPIKHQIEWYLIWAEMNGMDFDHRVKQPWARDPAFYVWFYPYPTDVPAREGPIMFGAVELPKYKQPLSAEDAAEITARFKKASAVFETAKINLTGNGKDLWVLGTRSIREQSNEFSGFAERVKDSFPALASAALEAKEASEQLAKWLDEQAPSKTGPSGVGKENYTWNLNKVHLLPYSWEDERLLMERELMRAHSALRFEEHQNRNLPKLEKASTPQQFDKMLEDAHQELMSFYKDQDIITIKDYMEPAMREQIMKFVPNDGIRGFFHEIHYRDPMPLNCHFFHWIELARIREEPNESLIRQHASLYNIFDARSEGMATAMEELMMNAGLYKNRPRGRELVYIMLAQRAARGLGGLYQHGLEMDFEGATKYASKWVPWGLLPADGETIQHEEHFYLQQPAYGTCYVIGKLEIDKLIAEYARQRNGNFVMKEFMDEFSRVGEIPVSLVYWQMTGDKSMLNKAIGQ